MKTLKKINNIALFTNLILFLIIPLGLLAQIPLGIIQVISAIYLTIKTFYKTDYAKKYLSIYWIIAIAELISVYLLYYHFQRTYDAIEWCIILVFPMSIAFYFYTIMNKIVEEYEKTNNSL